MEEVKEVKFKRKKILKITWIILISMVAISTILFMIAPIL